MSEPDRSGRVVTTATQRLTQIILDLMRERNDASDCIAAARMLVEEWDGRASGLHADAAALRRTQENSRPHMVLYVEARTTDDHADELRAVLGDDPDTTGDDRE